MRALLILLAACSSNPSSPDAAIDTSVAKDVGFDIGTSPFALTSTAIAPGASFPAANTCDGTNTSPDLTWTSPPANRQSYAVVMTDKTINLVHWVIYDIPPGNGGLTAAVMNAYAPAQPAGAHQTPSYQAQTFGYLGPCPPNGGGAHTYELAVYALDVAALPGASMTTTRAQAIAAIGMHTLDHATLTGMYSR